MHWAMVSRGGAGAEAEGGEPGVFFTPPPRSLPTPPQEPWPAGMCPLDVEPELAAARAERAASDERTRAAFDEGADGGGEDFVLHTPPRASAADAAAGALVPDASDCDERVALALLLSQYPARMGPAYSLGDGRRRSVPLALHFVGASAARGALSAVRSPTPLEQDLLGLAAQQVQALQAHGRSGRGGAGGGGGDSAGGGGGVTPRGGAGGSAGSSPSPSGRKVPPPPPTRRPPSAPPSARVASSGTTPRAQSGSGRVPPLSAGRIALTSAGGVRGAAAAGVDSGPLMLTGRSLAAGGDPSGWDSPPPSARPTSSASEGYAAAAGGGGGRSARTPVA